MPITYVLPPALPHPGRRFVPLGWQYKLGCRRLGRHHGKSAPPCRSLFSATATCLAWAFDAPIQVGCFRHSHALGVVRRHSHGGTTKVWPIDPASVTPPFPTAPRSHPVPCPAGGRLQLRRPPGGRGAPKGPRRLQRHVRLYTQGEADLRRCSTAVPMKEREGGR